jgi:uncharacterized protein
MSQRRYPVGLLAALTALALGASVLSAQQPRAPLELSSFPRTTLEITTHKDAQHLTHKYPFEVWVADTEERSEQGLMFVSDLPETQGMVFPVVPMRVENMWMKNTYIELDMLFIDGDGRVTKIIERAAPMSLQILSSDNPVAAVLELKGGAARKLGLRVGDAVVWKKPGA